MHNFQWGVFEYPNQHRAEYAKFTVTFSISVQEVLCIPGFLTTGLGTYGNYGIAGASNITNSGFTLNAALIGGSNANRFMVPPGWIMMGIA